MVDAPGSEFPGKGFTLLLPVLLLAADYRLATMAKGHQTSLR